MKRYTGTDDVSAIIMRAASRIEKRRQAGGPEVEGWVPLAHVPPVGVPFKIKKGKTPGPPPRDPLPTNHPIAANILAGLITPWPGE